MQSSHLFRLHSIEVYAKGVRVRSKLKSAGEESIEVQNSCIDVCKESLSRAPHTEPLQGPKAQESHGHADADGRCDRQKHQRRPRPSTRCGFKLLRRR
jgi:hypothetical protein